MDNSKELMLKTLNLKKSERIPVAPHWWGLYKYEALGLDYKIHAWNDGYKLSEVYINFYKKFQPDWFHLHIGTPKYFADSQIVLKNGKYYLEINKSLRKLKKEDKYFSVNSQENEEIVDFPDYLLGSRCNKPKVDLANRKKIDEFIKYYIHLSAAEIMELGYADHVIKIAAEYGKEVFIAVHIPSAICEIFDPTTGYLGFEAGLMAFNDYPEEMQYFLYRCYEEQLEWAKAYIKAGAHAFIISESFISADLVSPQIYKKFMKHIHSDYFMEIKNYGLIPMCMFWGNVNPLLKDYSETNVMAILVEESKKGFVLNINKIREQIGEKVCVFGNIDSLYLLREGSHKDIKNEAISQAEGAKYNFITSNGSPIALGTPQSNIEVLIKSGKELKWQ